MAGTVGNRDHNTDDHSTNDHIAESTDEVAESIVRVDIEAPPEEIWDALTTKEGLAAWMGDGSVVGAREGDELYVPDIVTGRARRGVLDEVSPHHRLGYTWWPESDPGSATRVCITLTPCVSGTRVTVVESLPTPSASLCRPSWGSVTASWHWRAALVSLSCGRPTTQVQRLTRPQVISCG